METSSSTTRILSTDTERTRLLKEVLRSTAQVTANARPGRRIFSELPVVSSERTENNPHRSSSRQSARTEDLAEFTWECEQIEKLVTHMDSTGKLASLLSDSGRRIVSLCSALTDSEEEVQAFVQSPPRMSATSSSHVRIIPRPQTGSSAARSWRAQADRAVAQAIDASASFTPLDELDNVIQQNTGLDELRTAELRSGCKAFPSYHRHNPGVFLLTDYALEKAVARREVKETVSTGDASLSPLALAPRPRWKEQRRIKLSLPRERSAPTLR